MSPAQLKLYRYTLVRWRSARAAAGRPHDDAARYELHRRCTGRACSSTALTNAEFDGVLAAMQAEIDPAGFAEQMRIQGSPELRREDLLARCDDALGEIVGGDVVYRRNYLAAICRQVSRKQATGLETLSERQLQQVMGILERRARQIGRPAAKAATPAPF